MARTQSPPEGFQSLLSFLSLMVGAPATAPCTQCRYSLRCSLVNDKFCLEKGNLNVSDLGGNVPMKIFAALYLISPAFFCLKLLGFSSEIAERECKEGKFTVHLEKTQLSVKNPMNMLPPLAFVSPSSRLGLAAARGAGRAGPCWKGELRTLPSVCQRHFSVPHRQWSSSLPKR